MGFFECVMSRTPSSISAVVDNGVLVWVTINSKSTGRGIGEMGEEVSYRLFV